MTTQQNKIILVTYSSGLRKWYPYTLENMEKFILNMKELVSGFVEIEIIEQGQ